MASSKTKPTLFFIHGLRGSHHGLCAVTKYLESDYNVINLDLPGYRNQPELSPQNLAAHIEHLHATIKNLPDKPVIVAHSMGATIASRYVAQYPDDAADKLVLMSPVFRGKSRRFRDKLSYYCLAALLSPIPKNVKKKLLASRVVSRAISHYLTADKSQQARIDQEHYLYSGHFASARSLLADTKLSMSHTAVVPEGKTVLLISGAKDRLSSQKLVRRMAARHSAAHHTITDSGHLINYERPEQVARIIADFLRP